MADRYVETAGLILEVETGDPTLSSHTGRKIMYIPPGTDGLKGDISTVAEVTGTAVAGEDGDSVNQGAPITLVAGILTFWSESVNPGGVPCVSPAFEVPVEKKGTVRR
jgi:hypothetical protein